MKGQDKIKEVKEFTYPGAIVRVHIPDLTAEERERRMNNFKKATEEFLKEVVKEQMKRDTPNTSIKEENA